MLHAFTNIEQIIANYPLRGIKGPVGTQQDLVDLLGGSEQVELLEEKVAIISDLPTHLIASARFTHVRLISAS